MRKLQLAGLLCLVLARGGLAQNSPAAFQLDQTMQRRYAAGDFNGTVLVARQGKVIYERAFGLANREWSVPNDLETKFEIGSMTKQFTAVLVLQFVSEGKLRLDGHVSEYLPYYRQDTGKRITISELLSHTSGLPSFTSIPGFLDGPASRVRYRVEEFVQKYCSGDLQFEPGTKFDYSNSGYFLLGAILERVSGETYEKLLRERIFGPLGMKNSGYSHSETVIEHRARGLRAFRIRIRKCALLRHVDSVCRRRTLFDRKGSIVVGPGSLYRAPVACSVAGPAIQTQLRRLRLRLGDVGT